MLKDQQTPFTSWPLQRVLDWRKSPEGNCANLQGWRKIRVEGQSHNTCVKIKKQGSIEILGQGM